ncbi:hypothetical protein D043_4079B, partial [Vibrio parahaemolyticus EKP-021]
QTVTVASRWINTIRY